MKTREKGKKIILNIIAIIFIIILISVLAQFAWARYMSTSKGNSEADIAQWKFNVTGEFFGSSEEINFASTRNDGNEHVATETIAPGTYGEFEIVIDASGSETNLIYEVNIQFTQKPKNLKIYTANKKEVNIQNNVLNYKKFLTYNDAQTVQTQKFYWEWPLETGTTPKEIYDNDLDDSEYINKKMLMNIAVTGSQAIESGANIVYNGNGATSGEMFGDILTENDNVSLAECFYKRKYEVDLDANGGAVENSKVISEYKFSHWSTDNTNQNVLFFSTEEKIRRARIFPTEE